MKKLFLILILALYGCVPHALAQTTTIDVLPNTNSTDSTAILNNDLRLNQNAINAIGGYFGSNGALGIPYGGTGQVTAQNALNALIGTSAQGDIIYYDGNNWSKLSAGTSGQFLKTQGAGANPLWATVISNVTSGNNYITSNKGRITCGLSSGIDGKVDEVVAPYSGTYKIKIGFGNVGVGTIQIYKNGSPVGTVRSTSGYFSEDISGVVAGDLIQLYVTAWTSDFRWSGIEMYVAETFFQVNQRSYQFTTASDVTNFVNQLSAEGQIGDFAFTTDGGVSTTLYVKTGSSTWTAK